MDSKLPSQKCQNSGFHWMKLSRGLKWCTEKLQINLTHFSWVEYTIMSHLDPLWGPLGTHNDSNRTSPLTKWSHLLSHLKVHKPPKDFERHICSRIHEFIWTTGTPSWKENVFTLPERECHTLMAETGLIKIQAFCFPITKLIIFFNEGAVEKNILNYYIACKRWLLAGGPEERRTRARLPKAAALT